MQKEMELHFLGTNPLQCERPVKLSCITCKLPTSFCQHYEENEQSLPLSWLIVVDVRDILPTSGRVLLDPSHLVSEYATSDNEYPALAHLSTQASVRVP